MAARALTQEQVAAQQRQMLGVAVTVAALAAVVLAWAWLAPVAIAWVHTGRVAHLTVVEAFRAVGTGRLLSGDPAAAYPAGVRVLCRAGGATGRRWRCWPGCQWRW